MARSAHKHATARSSRGKRQQRYGEAIGSLPRFLDYTAEEWATIDECVAKAGRQTGLRTDERIRLLEAAKIYQQAVIDAQHGTYAPLRKRREFFKQLQARLVQARRVLEKAAFLFGSDWRATEFIWVDWELIGQLCRRWFGEHYFPGALHMDEMEGYLTIGHVLDLISAFEEAASFPSPEGMSHELVMFGRRVSCAISRNDSEPTAKRAKFHRRRGCHTSW
jgi:hypothetical protein